MNCPACEEELVTLPWDDSRLGCTSCGYEEDVIDPARTRTRLGAMYAVRRSTLDNRAIKRLQKDLTARKEEYTGPDTTFPLWQEDGEWFYAPRHYGLSQYGPPDSFQTESGRRVALTFDGVLTGDQQRSCDALLKELSKSGGGILKAPTGTGKTPMALWIFAQLGRLPLVIVHKENMFDDWRKEIQKFLHLSDDEVGIVQGPSIGLTPRTKILLGTIQTLCKKDFDDDFLNAPGIVCLDEAARGAAEKWHQAVRKFPAHYRMGLTATPRRKDGLWKVIEWDVGRVVSEIEEARLTPRVISLRMNLRIPVESLMGWRDGRRELSLPKLTTWLAKHKGRNAVITSEIEKAAKTGRKIIVLSDRREQAELLCDDLKQAGISAEVFYGGLSEKERTANRSASVLLATYGYAQEALNIPALDTLFLATPRTDVEQALGRILRSHQSKKAPLVIDVVDSTSITQRMAARRGVIYASMGCAVRTVARNLYSK